MKLSELVENGLVKKTVTSGSPVTISYSLTEKGTALANSLKPIQEWAKQYVTVECTIPKESDDK